MASPGAASICFSCGQPLPSPALSPAPGPQHYPLTGAQESKLQPPPNPYGPPSVRLEGQAGRFTVRIGAEIKVGRDPSQCPITLFEARVSGVHATVKYENGDLWVRDEQSNNGTFVDGTRVPAGYWTKAPVGSVVKFGPVELAVAPDSP